MARAQQQDTHERATHTQRFSNFVIAHVRVIAQDKRHPRAIRQLGEARADFFAAVLGLQLFELAWIRMLEWHRLYVASFEVLADAPSPQQVPAVVAGHFVEPCGERPRRVVGAEFLPHFHEDFSCRILGIFRGGKRPPAKAEHGRGISAIKLSPGLRVTGPDVRQHLRQFRGAHLSGDVSPLHGLIRRDCGKYFTSITKGPARHRLIQAHVAARSFACDEISLAIQTRDWNASKWMRLGNR